MKKYMLGLVLMLCVFLGVSHAADYTAIANVTAAIDDGVASSTTTFWAVLTLSTAAIVAWLIFGFTRKGKR